MATNQKAASGRLIKCTPTAPASGILSGAPCILGVLPGVAVSDAAADGTVVLDTAGVYSLSVKGTTGSNSAVAVGDQLYYTDGNTPKIDKTTSGTKFGVALETVGSGATATIKVRVGA
jgi:predicted RecA/RadA family phage recombinase